MISFRALPLACALLLALPTTPPAALAAHEIPASVTVHAFVVPAGERLELLVRVPLLSMRDYDWPVVAPGYLDVAASRPWLADAAMQWLAAYTRIEEDGRTLEEPRIVAARLSLPSDRSFESWERARAHVTGGRLSDAVTIPPQQVLLDVLFEYDIRSADARFALLPEWAHLGLSTATALRFLPPEGGVRAFRFAGNPGLVRLDPSWWQAAWGFVALGFEHILGGIDHLLFVACLVIPFARFRALVPIVTAFTVGHSITLLAAAGGLTPGVLWFAPLVEMLIAASIVWMALENIVSPKLDRRWAFAFGFGLVHGFGFSFALGESLQFAGAHLVTSLLAFNVGVELGQLFVLALLVPALVLLFRHVVAQRMGVIMLSALIAHTAWHWMTARGAALGAYELTLPPPDLALLAAVLRWLALALVAAGAAWLLKRLFDRLRTGGTGSEAPTPVRSES
jgi:hypothetical protein